MDNFFDRLSVGFVFFLSGIFVSTSINLFTDLFLSSGINPNLECELRFVAILFLFAAFCLSSLADILDKTKKKYENSKIATKKWSTYYKEVETPLNILFFISLILGVLGLGLIIF